MRRTIPSTIRTFLFDESGPTAVEYAVMVAAIVVVCVVAVTMVGTNSNKSFSKTAKATEASTGSHPIGAVVNGGTTVSGGTWTWNSTMGPNVMEIYNADTGVDTWSWTGSNGPWYTATRNPGYIPGGTQHTWTRTQ